MRASDLRQRLIIERATDNLNDEGGVDRTWTDEGTVFGAVEARSRKEVVLDGRMAGTVTHLVTLRDRSDVGGDVRFIDGSKIYRVLATEAADPKRAFLRCLCEEEQS